MSGAPAIGAAHWTALDPRLAYAILRLRSIVFVVEQRCAYLDPDGRDLEPDARQLWIADGSEVVSTLRVLRTSDGGSRIGRVATHPTVRGRGLATSLMRHAVDTSARPVVLDAQEGQVAWYERFGFVVSGARFVEDGIAHVPMRLDAPTRRC